MTQRAPNTGHRRLAGGERSRPRGNTPSDGSGAGALQVLPGASGGSAGGWTCHACTFYNHAHLAQCEMCGTPAQRARQEAGARLPPLQHTPGPSPCPPDAHGRALPPVALDDRAQCSHCQQWLQRPPGVATGAWVSCGFCQRPFSFNPPRQAEHAPAAQPSTAPAQRAAPQQGQLQQMPATTPARGPAAQPAGRSPRASTSAVEEDAELQRILRESEQEHQRRLRARQRLEEEEAAAIAESERLERLRRQREAEAARQEEEEAETAAALSAVEALQRGHLGADIKKEQGDELERLRALMIQAEDERYALLDRWQQQDEAASGQLPGARGRRERDEHVARRRQEEQEQRRWEEQRQERRARVRREAAERLAEERRLAELEDQDDLDEFAVAPDTTGGVAGSGARAARAAAGVQADGTRRPGRAPRAARGGGAAAKGPGATMAEAGCQFDGDDDDADVFDIDDDDEGEAAVAVRRGVGVDAGTGPDGGPDGGPHRGRARGHGGGRGGQRAAGHSIGVGGGPDEDEEFDVYNEGAYSGAAGAAAGGGRGGAPGAPGAGAAAGGDVAGTGGGAGAPFGTAGGGGGGGGAGGGASGAAGPAGAAAAGGGTGAAAAAGGRPVGAAAPPAPPPQPPRRLSQVEREQVAALVTKEAGPRGAIEREENRELKAWWKFHRLGQLAVVENQELHARKPLRKGHGEGLREMAAAERATRRDALLASAAACRRLIAEVEVTAPELREEVTRLGREARRVHNEAEDMKGKIRVFVRTRPLNSREQALASQGVFHCLEFPDEEQRELVLIERQGQKMKRHEYIFDRAFPANATQEEVFADCGPLARSALDGYNVCCLAYGQTGSGKTWTLAGTVQDPGIARRSCDALFALRDHIVASAAGARVDVTATMCELYLNDFYDLLSPSEKHRRQPRKARPGASEVPGLFEAEANSAAELHGLFQRGEGHRTTRCTKMNDRSSRSHLIFTVRVVHKPGSAGDERRWAPRSAPPRSAPPRSAPALPFPAPPPRGKLIICDLAGSERLGKSQVDGDGMKEAIAINKSLSALGNVIEALSRGKVQHVPYRDHELTLVMQDSIGGSAKTLLFVNISPASDSGQESRCSLTFAQRAKHIVQGDKEAREKNKAALQAKEAELAEIRHKQESAQDRLREGELAVIESQRRIRVFSAMLEQVDADIAAHRASGGGAADGDA